jgi:hypothetical protein
LSRGIYSVLVKSGESYLKDRRKNFEDLLQFSNAEIESMIKRELAGFIYNLSLDQGPKPDGSNFLDFMETQKRLAGELLCNPAPEIIKERKEFLGQLQAHLRSRLDAIMKAAALGRRKKLFESVGVRSLVVDLEPDRFLEEFVERESEGDSLEIEKAAIDNRLVELIRDLDLKPGHFKKCRRCQKYFYQFTARGKSFCSLRCAGTARQTEYMKRMLEKNISLRPTADSVDTAGFVARAMEETQKP